MSFLCTRFSFCLSFDSTVPPPSSPSPPLPTADFFFHSLSCLFSCFFSGSSLLLGLDAAAAACCCYCFKSNFIFLCRRYSRASSAMTDPGREFRILFAQRFTLFYTNSSNFIHINRATTYRHILRCRTTVSNE